MDQNRTELVETGQETAKKLDEVSDACCRITAKLNSYIQKNGNSKKLKDKCQKFHNKVEKTLK